jgi:hypothetical protein
MTFLLATFVAPNKYIEKDSNHARRQSYPRHHPFLHQDRAHRLRPAGRLRVPADLGNWSRWAVVNVKSTRRSDDPNWWDMVAPRRAARLGMRADARHGIFDHDFIDPQASWTVPARVIANGGGAEFIITFFQPPGFTDAFFDQQIKLVDIELAKLKELLENAP